MSRVGSISTSTSTNTLHRIRPPSTIPICLDLGTNNEKFLQDDFYLGLRQKRVSDDEMTEFMDEFMHEMSVTFPKLLVQFEASFSKASRTRHDEFVNRTSRLITPSLISNATEINILYLMMTFKEQEPSYSVDSGMLQNYPPLRLVAPLRTNAYSSSALVRPESVSLCN